MKYGKFKGCKCISIKGDDVSDFMAIYSEIVMFNIEDLDTILGISDTIYYIDECDGNNGDIFNANWTGDIGRLSKHYKLDGFYNLGLYLSKRSYRAVFHKYFIESIDHSRSLLKYM